MHLPPWGNGPVSKHRLIPVEVGQTYPCSLSNWRLTQGMFWDVETLTSLVSASLKQEFLLDLWRTVPKNEFDSPWFCAMQTRTTGSHDRIGSSCQQRLREGGTQGMSPLVSHPVNRDQSAAAYDETGLWGISFCVAGQLVCVSVWALQPWPSFEEAGLLFCVRLQIVWHLLVCVVC